MKKTWKIISGVALVILIILGNMYVSLVSSKTTSAQLNIESGSVLLNGNQVNGNLDLKKGDIIETLEDGKATIILYENIVVSLEPNTKINVDDLKKEHPKLSQDKGETWNTITKITGTKEYTISSGNSVASVRGTEFIFSLDKIIVFDGEVDYKIDGQNYKVSRGSAVEKIKGVVNQRSLTSDELKKADDFRRRTVEQLKILREKEINKHPRTVDFVKKKYELTDTDIKQGLEDADNGLIDIEEIERQAPVNIASLKKVVRITKEIKEINQEIQPTTDTKKIERATPLDIKTIPTISDEK